MKYTECAKFPDPDPGAAVLNAYLIGRTVYCPTMVMAKYIALRVNLDPKTVRNRFFNRHSTEVHSWEKLALSDYPVAPANLLVRLGSVNADRTKITTGKWFSEISTFLSSAKKSVGGRPRKTAPTAK